MDIRRPARVLVFLIVLGRGAAQLPATETLCDAWSAALIADQGLQASCAEVEAARCNYEAAQRSYLPSVSNRTYYNVLTDDLKVAPGPPIPAWSIVNEQFVVTSTQASLPLYTGGRIRSTIEATGATVSAREAGYATDVLDLKLEVTEAYVALLRCHWSVRVAQRRVESLESHERDVQNRLDQGLVARNDLLAVQVELADARQRVLETRTECDIALAAYNRLLGQPLSRTVTINDLKVSETAYDLECATQTALGLRPEIKNLAARADALCAEADVRASELRPHASVQGGFIYLQNENLRPNAIGDVQFAVEWTPIDGGVVRRQATALAHQSHALQKLRIDTESRIALEVRTAWLDLRQNRERITVAEKAIEQADENLRITRNRFNQGVGTNTEVLDAETLRTQAQLNYYHAVYNAVLSEFRLQRAMGEL